MKVYIDNVTSHLLAHNIKPSYPRIKILEYLVNKHTHPTVEEIYNSLIGEIPTLSKTTVYNTLNLFIAANMARVVSIEENEARYDADIGEHGHFKCEACGTIYDFIIKIDSFEVSELKAFQINQKDVFYKGICQECLKNKKINKEE